MAAQPEPEIPLQFEVNVPEDQSAGTYSNGFATWFNQTDLTIDFFIHLPMEPRTDDEGNPFMHVPVEVVSRVKIPPTLVFRLIEQLNSSYTAYEEQFGAVTPLGEMPGQPDIPPPG